MRSGLALIAAVLLASCVPITAPATPGPASPTPMPSGSERPTATPGPTPTPTPTPTPQPTPDPAAMELEVTSCNGGTVLGWSPSMHPDFHHYIGLRSPEDDIDVQYPPIAPAVDWGDLYATDRFVASGHDATVVPSDTDWFYRVVAYDVAGRPVSRSNVASGKILPHRDLGELAAEVLDSGSVRLTWDAFDGRPSCFSAYRVMYGSGGIAGTLLTSISEPERVEIETTAFNPGVTYTVRVQAVRTTTIGHFVAGETEPLTLNLPSDP